MGETPSAVRSAVTLYPLPITLYPSLQCLRLLPRLFDRAHHVEGLLGEMVVLASDDALETLDGVLERHVLALLAGEVLGHREGLRQEALDLARPRHGELVLRRELVHAQDRDDVAQLLIAL